MPLGATRGTDRLPAGLGCDVALPHSVASWVRRRGRGGEGVERRGEEVEYKVLLYWEVELSVV